ncbi:sarcosine oxidase subunit gamma [Metapseudomonas furukawaii]|uniref:Sarcosine oxidase gamma subunit n=1 Tax=Metapseudomonas furukawaii TaxID=1149133 RepID=A0AAD1BX81_METFU|nr:sarcosine oxidase subunit gamma family protein [Pseudomonas furukawaii]WAG79518.1 sarcosine oxidase subunit gamma family protein [Pseudomonas furukawaii]BAU72097.1 sarcosine oxidase gamma subunit [Pseudomonas furukawaii]
MSNVNVYKQRPDKARAESPLYHAGLDELARKGKSNAGVILREKKLLGHLVIRGDASDPAFAGGVHKALGLELPVALTLVANGDSSLQWLGPDEWLLVVPGGTEYEVEQRLRAALEGQHISVVNVSGGQTLLELSGPHARDVLMKSTVYDVHPSNFPVGKAVGTTFAKAGAVIRHTGEDTWELVIRRSFSDYLWLWLQDASAEYGLAVKA